VNQLDSQVTQQEVGAGSDRERDADPQGKIMEISQLQSALVGNVSNAFQEQSGRSVGSDSDGGLQGRVLDISQLPSAGRLLDPSQLPQSAPRTDQSMADSRGELAVPIHSKLDMELTKLPSPSAQWRAPDALEPATQEYSFSDFPASSLLPPPPRGKEGQPGQPLPPPAIVRRNQDSVQQHLKPHAWDLASLGQEAPQAQQAWTAAGAADGGVAERPGGRAHAQPPLGRGLEPMAGGARGFGGERGLLPPGTEAQLVERLAQRFVLDRKAPACKRRERSAYQEMLQQVAWTALEPSAAQEAALLLSQRWLQPVSPAEALRAFRRCLHAILCDERVVDIVEHQMTLHFGRNARARQ